MNPEEVELRAIFRGRVQGVGFRWTIQAHAEKKGINGLVQNLPNGTVELIAQGTKERLLELLKAIKEEPGHAQIVAIDTEFRAVKSLHSGFRIDI